MNSDQLSDKREMGDARKRTDRVRKEREGKKRDGSTEGNSHGRRKRSISRTFYKIVSSSKDVMLVTHLHPSGVISSLHSSSHLSVLSRFPFKHN